MPLCRAEDRGDPNRASLRPDLVEVLRPCLLEPVGHTGHQTIEACEQLPEVACRQGQSGTGADAGERGPQPGDVPGDTARVVGLLGGLGFEHLGQTGGPGREYLRRRTGRLANIAVVERRGPLWADNIMFRDYLRAHSAAAARYAQVKLHAAEQVGMLTAYCALKAATVAEIMREARRAQSDLASLVEH